MPDRYTDFEVPEGYSIHDEDGAALRSFAAERNMSQEDAQALVNLGVKLSGRNTSKWNADRDAQHEKWADAVRNDRELGGEKMKERLALINRTISKEAPELHKLLNSDAAYGNHPELLRGLYRLSVKLGAAGKPAADAGESKDAARASRRYPNSNHN